MILFSKLVVKLNHCIKFNQFFHLSYLIVDIANHLQAEFQLKKILTLTLEFPDNYSKECVLWRNVTSPHRHVYAQNIPQAPAKAPFTNKSRSYSCWLFVMLPSPQAVPCSTRSTLFPL